MSKAILVIDFWDEAGIDISKVKANVKLFNEDDGNCFAVYKNLPIMYVPNEKVSEGDEYWSMYAGGWNDCLIEIKSVNEDRK